MEPPVHRDLVARGSHIGSERAVALDLLAYQEEGAPGAGRGERREDRRSALRVRSVVEGERDPAPVPGQPPVHAERVAECGRVRCQARPEPGRGGAETERRALQAASR